MRSLYLQLKRIVTSTKFGCCILFTIILLFFAQIFLDSNTEDRYSVTRVLIEFSKEEMTFNYEMCNTMILQNACSGWFSLFAPIIAAFCFVPTICSEREEKASRFQIFRTTKLNFGVSQFFSGVVSGGAAISLGYIIFAVFVMILFPNIDEISGFSAEILQETAFNLPLLTLKVFLFGAFWSIPAMLLTSVLNNKYLIMCIPFFLKYGLKQLHQKISQDAFSAVNTDKNAITLANAINPDGILWVYDETRLVTWLVFGISAALMFAAFIIINRKRVDCGA